MLNWTPTLRIETILHLSVTENVTLQKSYFLPKYDPGARVLTVTNPFTEEELNTFCVTVEQRWAFYYPLFFTLSKTGIRVGEAMALDWSHVDFQDRTLLIEGSYTDGKMGPPKGRRARKVDLSQDTVRVLKQHYKDMMELKLKKGWKELGPVFPNMEGGRLELSNLRGRVFVKALEKAKLGHRRIHDLRHSYASLLLMKGANVLYVSQQLGHRSVDITLQNYARWLPSDERMEVDGLDTAQPNETQAKPEQGTWVYEESPSPSTA